MDGITIKQAQKIVDEWINKYEGEYWPPLSMLASLTEEVGELAREINDKERVEMKEETKSREGIGLQLADALFSLICLANYYDVDLETKFNETIVKYSNRERDRLTR